MPLDALGEVPTDGAGGDGRGTRSAGGLVDANLCGDRFDPDEEGAGHDGRTEARQQLRHPPRLRRGDVVVHLHRLDQQQHVTGSDHVTHGHLDRHDCALQEAADLRHRPAL